MPRYIETDILAKIVFDKWQECDELKRIIPAIQKAIMCASTADVVDVVRCKECKYGHELLDEKGRRYRLCNYHFGHGLMVEDHGFCKWGKRRDDADN